MISRMFFGLRKHKKKSKKLEIGTPTQISQGIHAFVNPDNGDIVGLPDDWSKVLNDQVPAVERKENPVAALHAVTFFQNYPNETQNSSDTPQTSPTNSEDVKRLIQNQDNDSGIVTRGSSSSKDSYEGILNEFRKVCKTTDPLEKYKMAQEVGRGACGIILVAHDLENDIDVAVKSISLESSPDKRSMINELHVMKELRHPNLTNFLEAYFIERETKYLWIIMEFMDGGTLTDVVIQTVLRERQLAGITYEILQGINFLHSKKIIHRDIKSDNILLGLNGTVKISDFGFSVKVEYGDNRTTMVGTPVINIFLKNYHQLFIDPSLISSTGCRLR